MRSPTILAIDDNEVNLDVIQEIVDGQYPLWTAFSGEEGLALALEHQPDIILLDIMMPGIDGYETCRRIRALPDLVACKVVMLSAKPYLEDRLQSYAAGADDYLTKPVDEDELLAKIRVFSKLKSGEEIDAIKTTLLTVLDHEIRTPLTGILPSVEMLCADGEMDEAERKLWAETARENALRLVSLAERSLLLCRLEQEQADLHWEPLDLAATLKGLSIPLREGAPPIVIKAESEAVVMADRQLLHEFLLCLFEGAAKAFSGAMTVRVEVADGAVKLRVQTSEPSASHSEPAELLEPLGICQVDGEVVGSDIALPLACSIARAHGATVLVEVCEDDRMSLETVFPQAAPVAD